MEFKKEQITKEEWVLDTGKRKIPLNALRLALQGAMLVLVAFMASNFGSWAAMEMVKHANYMAGGTCDATTGECLHCVPTAQGSKVTWDCQPVERNYTSNTTVEDIVATSQIY